MKDASKTKAQLLEELTELRQRFAEIEASVPDRERVEEQLNTSEETYHTVVDNSLAGIFMVQGGRFVFVNNRMAQINGYDSGAENHWPSFLGPGP